MIDCTHEFDHVPCPDACSETEEHSHWRCVEGHAWLFWPRMVTELGLPPDLAVTHDLTQPARCIYPVASLSVRVPAPRWPPMETTFGTWLAPTEYLPMVGGTPLVAEIPAAELLIINRNIDPNRPPSGVDARGEGE